MSGVESEGTERALRALGYDRLWIESGLLSDAVLADQLARYEQEGNAEHLRWESFQRLLGGDALDDKTVALVLALAAVEPDPSVARSAVGLLLGHRRLTDEQLALVRVSPLADPRLVRRAEMLLVVRQSQDQGAIAACARDGDAEVQLALLGRKQPLGDEIISLLESHGRSGAIRNMARQRRKSRRRSR